MKTLWKNVGKSNFHSVEVFSVEYGNILEILSGNILKIKLGPYCGRGPVFPVN